MRVAAFDLEKSKTPNLYDYAFKPFSPRLCYLLFIYTLQALEFFRLLKEIVRNFNEFSISDHGKVCENGDTFKSGVNLEHIINLDEIRILWIFIISADLIFLDMPDF
jgi:hypothetical protein